jgi:curli biogenesis system outer membrane secretion channel CsgG
VSRVHGDISYTKGVLMTKLAISLAAFLCLVCLSACGEKEAQLTTEQQKAASQMEESFNTMKAKAESTIEDLKKSASTSPEVKKAQDDINTSMTSAQTAVKSLREEGSKTFDQKKTEVEAALNDLTSKIGAAAKAKLGGMMPKM